MQRAVFLNVAVGGRLHNEQPTMGGRRRVMLLVAGCWLALATLVQADGGAEARWLCPYTQEGSCVPATRTYGFYPTRWRKWPESGKRPTPAEPVKTPKPAKPAEPEETNEELPPAAPRDTSSETPDEMPAELPRTTPTLPGETDTEPDLPPSLQGDMPQQPLEEDLEHSLPKAGSGNTTPPRSSQEPRDIGPEEDPFSDDPLQEGDAPTDGARRPATDRSASIVRGMRWRPDPRLKTAAKTSASATRRAEQIAPATAGAQPASATLPAAAAMPIRKLDNPLRAGASAAAMVLPSPVAEDEVVSTASWSPDEAAPANAKAGWHSNPLRTAR